MALFGVTQELLSSIPIAAQVLFARFREEDVQPGKLVSKEAALKNLVKSEANGMKSGLLTSRRTLAKSTANAASATRWAFGRDGV